MITVCVNNGYLIAFCRNVKRPGHALQRSTTKPITAPPTTPRTIIGMYALVIIALVKPQLVGTN